MSIFSRKLTITSLLSIDEGRIERSENLDVIYNQTYFVIRTTSIYQKILNFLGIKVNLLYAIVKYRVASDSGRTYTVLLETNPQFNSSDFLANNIRVFCSCDDFKYRAAYTLGSTDNLYLNTPTKSHLGIALTTRPTRVDTTPCCKHCFAAINDLNKNFRKYKLV